MIGHHDRGYLAAAAIGVAAPGVVVPLVTDNSNRVIADGPERCASNRCHQLSEVLEASGAAYNPRCCPKCLLPGDLRRVVLNSKLPLVPLPDDPLKDSGLRSPERGGLTHTHSYHRASGGVVFRPVSQAS